MGHPGQNISLSVVLHGERSIEQTTISYSELMIERVTGCMDFHPSTVNCHSSGSHSITLHGKGFGNTGARVWLGEFECGTVTHGIYINNTLIGGEDERVVCSSMSYMTPTTLPSYHPTGEYPPHPAVAMVTPTIRTVYGLNFTQQHATISFSRRPEVTFVEGCTLSFYKNHTKACFTNGTMTLTVRGKYFIGTQGFGVPSIWVGPYECKKIEIISDVLLRCLEYPGLGVGHRIEVRRGIVGTPWGGEFREISGYDGVKRFITSHTGNSMTDVADAASWLETNIETENIMASYRPLPVVRTITGCGCSAELISSGLTDCAKDSLNHTVLCPTKGTETLTLTGFNFGETGADVYIGSRLQASKKCETVVHDSTTPDTKLTCVGYRYAGSDLRVTAVRDDEESKDNIFLSFTEACPYWNHNLRIETIGPSFNGTMCNSRGACDNSCPGTPAVCQCTASTTEGYWDGYACQDCKYGYYGSACILVCPGGSASPCNGNGLCLGGLFGPGTCDCYDGYAGLSCDKACPRDFNNEICGGFITSCSNGTAGTGTCTCPTNAGDGYWSGSACDTCLSGYSQGCRIECAGGAGIPCQGRGTCDEGPTGNGTCSCTLGYAGTQCEIPCDGGPTNPCSFHGECISLTGKCDCYRSESQGFWDDAQCSTCQYGYSSPTATTPGCITPCPRNETGAVCSDIGSCVLGVCLCPEFHLNEKVCGTSCNITGRGCDIYACPDGYYGPSCGQQCPGFATDQVGTVTVCNTHGACSDGKQGNGLCNCDSGYGSVDCIECPGGATSPCTGRGTCSAADGLCTCYSGYAGSDCSIACKGGALTPCNNHGTCNSGSTGDGSCTCDYGYLGQGCESECPGSASTPCNGHGNCTASGVCVCEDSLELGHWTGTSCDRCLPDWFGTNCLKTCPKSPNGKNCSDHGTCPTEVEFCNCDASPEAGYWEGTVCDTCQSGYWGSGCQGVCPGGACNPCSGHGSCSEGVMGYGWCNCTSNNTDGWWSKTDCSDCKEGWYGGSCTKECPGGWIEPCSGNGVCNAGQFGSGSCACYSDPNNGGVWSGVLCDNCANGWYAPNCSLGCPSSNGQICGGKGVCDYGITGTGLCDCFAGSAGENCDQHCPKSSLSNLVCSGFAGACSDGRAGTALCTCPRDPVIGYWIEPTCEDCRPGYGGETCIVECPGGANNPCSGNGFCSTGITGTGLCTCQDGYSGTACEFECAGGAGNPCNRRGVCNSDGSCTCYASTDLGYWRGDTCNECLVGWSGSNCNLGCPVGLSSLACSGRGRCYQGACYDCGQDFCGSACELSGVECSGFLCPPAMFGLSCDALCDGTNTNVDPPEPCNGHGSCSDGKFGDGKCLCFEGYAGELCSLECDGGASTPCSFHGTCNQTHTGACTCDHYFSTPTCAVACKGYGEPGSVCSSRGTCNMGASGDGKCVCERGYAGEKCDKECPGGYKNPCSGHGTCDTLTAACSCIDNEVDGHFGGLECNNCKDGYFGDSCSEICPSVSGTTSGRECACSEGWAWRDCSIECIGGAGNPCNRNGVCNATNAGDGTCICNIGFRGFDCSVRCAGHAATGKECSGNGICSNDGSCTCNQDSTLGFWSPPDCGSCLGEYFGLMCDQLCPKGPNGLPCSGHGTCPKTRGVCDCRSDTDGGYWEGLACEMCQTGYWGFECRNPCPGGACDPCSGHGICDSGVTGTGICACFDTPGIGYWKGTKCDSCAVGYWGSECKQECPGGLTPETWCSGHGDCSQGPTGSGDCICFDIIETGWWSGLLCQDCAAGYFGPTCQSKCPGKFFACEGNGVCDDMMTGSGLCTCNRGYAGEDCSLACPKGPNGDYCSGALNGPGGQEACQWGAPGQFNALGGTGACHCPGTTPASGASYGFLAGVACGKCISGYASSDCKTTCPGVNSFYGVCSSNGKCEDGKSGTGKCVCDYGYAGSSCDVVCTGGFVLPCNGRGKCQQGDPGPPLIVSGSCVCFESPITGYWDVPDCSSCLLGWSGQNCNIKCSMRQGLECGGNGQCLDGICFCDAGYCGGTCEFQGPAACSAYFCPAGYWGQSCEFECVGGASLPCTGHGNCREGKQGDGACTCFNGYATASCSKVCDGGALYPCGGSNGFCNTDTGKCTCKSGFAGFDCQLTCKGGVGNPCTGHGVCSEGAYLRGTPPASGTGECTCHFGYAGEACELTCPGGAETPCNFHGDCMQNDGSCRCHSDSALGFWEGIDCSTCQQGFSGEECLMPCLYGESLNGICVCHSGYANTNCSMECAGFISEGYKLPCAGNGKCFEGNKGNGSCACDMGYVGAFCDLDCPGRQSGSPCSGTGTCVPSGSGSSRVAKCVCSDSSALGHWAGVDCSKCATGWFTSTCDRTCPSQMAHPILCSSHGECDPSRIQCNCFSNSTHGFWDGTDCRDCAAGYWGASCENECAGGACKPCVGHGSCFDGLCPGGNCENWRGSCNCTRNDVDGYWTGTKCDACVAGYYSSSCVAVCPGGVDNVCTKRGTCSEGQYGDGSCKCQYASDTGYWGRDACQDCWVGYYGTGCKLQCPGNVFGKPITCSGQGSCSDGEKGTGICTCDPGYAGPDCGVACPRSKLPYMESIKVCTGHGLCADGIDGTGLCSCTTDVTLGRWTGSSCSSCTNGYWGESCLNECPGGALSPCSNHGTCSQGTSGAGTCTCYFGWSLSDCSRECNGGSARPCFGKGTCKPADGSCECDKSPTTGYWSGSMCDQCAYGWSGVQCDMECPHNGTALEPGIPCSGVGTCRDAACYSCEAGRCNSPTKKACDMSGEECLAHLCGTNGQWGPNCENECPGGIGIATCSGRGACSDGKLGNGLCACDSGYMFADCSSECPGGAGTPCNNQGLCNTIEGTCKCFAGYAGKACQIECPGGYHNPCNAHGVCDDGSSRNGTCTCSFGWAGTACDIPCTGGSIHPCSGNGDCSKIDGNCTCFGNVKTGFWEGANCDLCQQGFYGSNCTTPCYNGRSGKNPDASIGGTCFCDQFWATPACDLPCPKSNDTAALPCSGNGYCLDGHTNGGICVCDADYYGTDCGTHCHPDVECDHLAHAQCNPLTGTCECQDSVDGHYAGLKCDSCKDFWWGDLCLKECLCLFHGTCDRGTGACNCFLDQSNGHWAGESCSYCADGYVGFECMSKDVRITRTADFSTPVRFQMKVTGVGTNMMDTLYGLQYVGGRPVLLFNAAEDILDMEDLGAAVVDAWIGTEKVFLITSDDLIYSYFRGKKTFASARAGDPVAAGNSISADSIVAGARRRFTTLSRSPFHIYKNSSIPTWQTDQVDNTISDDDAKRVLQSQPLGRNIDIPVGIPHRGIITLGSLGLKLVRSLTDTAQDLVYLVWTGANARQVHYQRSSTMSIVRIADVSNQIDEIHEAVFFASIGQLCLAGSKNGKWEIVLFRTATLIPRSLSTDITVPSCETCSAAVAVQQSGLLIFVSIKIDFGLKMARINLQTKEVIQYDTLRNQISNAITVSVLKLDPLSGAGFVFTHIDANPTTVYKFQMMNLQIYGMTSFLRTGTAVERIISATLDEYVSFSFFFFSKPLSGPWNTASKKNFFFPRVFISS